MVLVPFYGQLIFLVLLTLSGNNYLPDPTQASIENRRKYM